MAVRAGKVCPLPPEMTAAERYFQPSSAAPNENPSAAKVRISRRLALKQIALGAAAFSLGLQNAPAPIGPVYNNNLGLVLDITWNGTPIVAGSWYSVCTDFSGANCTNPIWRNLTAASGYVNNNYAGNNAGFTSSGGLSDMIVQQLPLTTGKLYQFVWNVQILNSGTNNDNLQFIIAPNKVIDQINRTLGRSDRSVLCVAQENMAFVWRFNKYSGANSIILFRVDNLRITELPTPVLHTEAYSATEILVWWDNVYGNDSTGSVLLESDDGLAGSWLPADGVPFIDATRFGKVFTLSKKNRPFASPSEWLATIERLMARNFPVTSPSDASDSPGLFDFDRHRSECIGSISRRNRADSIRQPHERFWPSHRRGALAARFYFHQYRWGDLADNRREGQLRLHHRRGMDARGETRRDGRDPAPISNAQAGHRHGQGNDGLLQRSAAAGGVAGVARASVAARGSGTGTGFFDGHE